MPFNCFICHRQYGINFNYRKHSQSAMHQKNCLLFIEKMKKNTCKLTMNEERDLKIAKEDMGLIEYKKKEKYNDK